MGFIRVLLWKPWEVIDYTVAAFHTAVAVFYQQIHCLDSPWFICQRDKAFDLLVPHMLWSSRSGTTYAVTAKHVIENLRRLDVQETIIRLK